MDKSINAGWRRCSIYYNGILIFPPNNRIALSLDDSKSDGYSSSSVTLGTCIKDRGKLAVVLVHGFWGGALHSCGFWLAWLEINISPTQEGLGRQAIAKPVHATVPGDFSTLHIQSTHCPSFQHRPLPDIILSIDLVSSLCCIKLNLIGCPNHCLQVGISEKQCHR